MLFPARKKISMKKLSYKQCPECSEKLPLHIKRCTQCGQRTGPVQYDGKAQKPIDWKGYLLSVIFIALWVMYLKWAFFRDF